MSLFSLLYLEKSFIVKHVKNRKKNRHKVVKIQVYIGTCQYK